MEKLMEVGKGIKNKATTKILYKDTVLTFYLESEMTVKSVYCADVSVYDSQSPCTGLSNVISKATHSRRSKKVDIPL